MNFNAHFALDQMEVKAFLSGIRFALLISESISANEYHMFRDRPEEIMLPLFFIIGIGRLQNQVTESLVVYRFWQPPFFYQFL